METKFPATQTVHWPSGPVDVCDQHADKLVKLGNFLGNHIAATKAADGAECGNCRNEAPPEVEH